jgi:hypothetical protein
VPAVVEPGHSSSVTVWASPISCPAVPASAVEEVAGCASVGDGGTVSLKVKLSEAPAFGVLRVVVVAKTTLVSMKFEPPPPPAPDSTAADEPPPPPPPNRPAPPPPRLRRRRPSRA